MIRAGLVVIAALQVIAAAAAYPVLTLAIGLASSFLRTATSPEAGARTVLFLAGLPMAFGVLITAGIFVAVPLGVCIAGAIIVGRLGRRRGGEVTVSQLLSFASALVLIDVVVMVAGVVLRPMWWYSEKLATLMPLWPLLVGFALNGVVDSVVAAVILRAQLRPRREGAG